MSSNSSSSNNNNKNNPLLILIRHTESTTNRDKRATSAAWNNVKTFSSLPTASQLGSAVSLLSIPMDGDVSPDGERMILEQHKRVHGNVKNGPNLLLADYPVDLIIHSHLRRARRTCHGLFPTTNVPIQEHTEIYEKSIKEYVGMGCIHDRVNAFKKWVLDSKLRCVVVVGHSLFFRILLGQTERIKNCEIVSCVLDSSTMMCVDVKILFPGGKEHLLLPTTPGG
eukprot:PhM_4_TR10176/c0_g1_i1/m.4181